MKRIPIYDALDLRSDDEVFDYLTDTFTDAVRAWDYFVNWEKVDRNTKKLHEKLATLNQLLGVDDFDTRFKELLRKEPALVTAIPWLIVRDGTGSTRFKILVNENSKNRTEDFDFGSPIQSEEEINRALEFVKRSGLVGIFKPGGVQNLHDYYLGVEAGVDSNGRKNRSGTAMENLIEGEIRAIVNEHTDWDFMSQATATSIKNKWGVELPGKPSARRSDFAVLANMQVTLIEVNIYGGGGSKLKSVAGEFTDLALRLSQDEVKMIWITDGPGWLTALRPLRHAFDELDFVFNLDLLGQGAMSEAIISK
jgi:type II restriction enzyme